MRKLYLYLASRCRQGIKVISILQSDKIVNSSITNLEELKLPKIWNNQIGNIIHNNRMLYEAKMETAGSFQELRDRLKDRGFSNLPSDSNPMLDLGHGPPPKADTSKCKVRKTMLRKPSE